MKAGISYALLMVIVLRPCPSQGEMGVFYYHPKEYGSEAIYNPLNVMFAYSFDTVQLSDNFDTHNFSGRLSKVLDHLTHPGAAIRDEGGTRAFINRQIYPMKGEDYSERYAMVPNYFLHLFGGGMVYRKDAEFFQEKGCRFPRIYSAALAMVGEIAQEAIEKKSTTSDDEVADVLLFRPLGILLFSSDAVAGFVENYLSPAIWPHLLMYGINDEKFINTGINYVIRPNVFMQESFRFFAYMGMNNLFGLSHRLGKESWLSWGLGLATSRVDYSHDIPAEFRFSGGVFYDRNNSLMWSVIASGTENLALRINLYPVDKPVWKSLGFFAGVTDGGYTQLGVTLNIPIGVGVSFK